MSKEEVFNISPNEKIIIEIMRSLEPFERFEVVANKDGAVDSYLTIRSSKQILTNKDPKNIP